MADEQDIRERLVRVEEQTREIPRIRERIHDIANTAASTLSMVEEGTDERKDLSRKIEALTVTVNSAILASARSEATMASTIASHIEQCRVDKAEIKAAVSRQESDQKERHSANIAAQDEIRAQLVKLRMQMAMYAGAIIVVTWILSHGIEIAEKLLKLG